MKLFFGTQMSSIIDLVHAAIELKLKPIGVAEMYSHIAASALTALKDHWDTILFEIIPGFEEDVSIINFQREMFNSESITDIGPAFGFAWF